MNPKIDLNLPLELVFQDSEGNEDVVSCTLLDDNFSMYPHNSPKYLVKYMTKFYFNKLVYISPDTLIGVVNYSVRMRNVSAVDLTKPLRVVCNSGAKHDAELVCTNFEVYNSTLEHILVIVRGSIADACIPFNPFTYLSESGEMKLENK
jgi:hypothetical protein